MASKRAYPRLPKEGDSNQLWLNRGRKSTGIEEYKALWISESLEHSNSLPEINTHGAPTTLTDMEELCWDKTSTLSINTTEQLPSAWEKANSSDKARIRGRKLTNTSKKGSHSFKLLEKAWEQLGEVKKEINAYTRQY